MGKIPKPARPETSLTALWEKYLKSPSPDSEFIKAAIRAESSARLMVLTLLTKGYSPEQISGAFGNTRQAVDDMARKTLRSAWKRINNIPRYYIKGRKARTA